MGSVLAAIMVMVAVAVADLVDIDRSETGGVDDRFGEINR